MVKALIDKAKPKPNAKTEVNFCYSSKYVQVENNFESFNMIVL